MKTLLKVLAYIVATVVGLVIVALITVSVLASKKLNEKFDIPAIPALTIATDSASIERGRRLATAVANCTQCHGEDLGGQVFMDAGPMGVAAGPNLTRGTSGLGVTFKDADWVRAIRYGIRSDSTSLLIMPSPAFAHFSDGDLAALIAYIKQVPPVERTVPKTELRLLGKILMVTGAAPFLVAEETPRLVHAEVQPAVSVEYGKYLANVGGCLGCHTPTLAGGLEIGPPGTPKSSNLTPAGPIAKWSEQDFFRAIREGKRPDGSAISEFMPWKALGRMSDDELRAILMYLRSVPAVTSASD